VTHASLLSLHIRLREYLMDSSGILMVNFLVANFCLCVLQSPFSSSSSFAGSWLWGELGCQLYAFIGFLFGIGVIFALGLLILDRYMQVAFGYNGRGAWTPWIMIVAMWHIVLVFSAPPLLDIFGRYGLEPSGTMCTIDFWHGNFRNYNNYVFFLVTCAFGIPIAAMLYMFLKTAHYLQDPDVTKKWSAIQLEHHTALTKTCGFLFMAQMICWSPYAILVLWTVVFPPSSLNIYYTIIPPIMCKITPVINSALVWWNIPRVQAGYRFLRNDRTGMLPAELEDMAGAEEGDAEEKASLTPA